MRLFEGLTATDYQDLLRALGRELDAAGARDLRLIETDAGMTVQVRHGADLRAGFATRRYSDEELLPLLQAAYARRGSGNLTPPPIPPLGLPYQDALRAIGRRVDLAGLRNLRLIEQPGAIIVQGTQGGVVRRGYRSHRVTAVRLHLLAARGATGRPDDLGPELA